MKVSEPTTPLILHQGCQRGAAIILIISGIVAVTLAILILQSKPAISLSGFHKFLSYSLLDPVDGGLFLGGGIFLYILGSLGIVRHI